MLIGVPLHFAASGGVMTRRFTLFLFFFALCIVANNQLLAQEGTVQVKGIVYDETGGTTLPYAHVLSSKWATTTNIRGLFEAPLERHDTIKVSFVGFKDYQYTIPSDYDDDEITANIIMERDTIYLEEAQIFFLPENEEEFKQAIIDLKLDEIEYTYALRNISLLKRQLQVVNYDKDKLDAAENARHYLNGPQPVYFNVVFDKLRNAMRKGRRKKTLPELEDINPSSFSAENNKVGISAEDQKAFADSVRIQTDSTFIKILESIKEGKNDNRK